MPATRPSSHPHASGDPLSPSPQSTTRPSSKHKKVPAPKSKPVVLAEVIEISSDDDEPPPRVHSLDLRRQVKKLREEISRLKAELTTSGGELSNAKKEIVELKAASRPGKLDLRQFDDDTSCEICTSRMWSPFILPECGHTFCLSCLQDWFGTTLAQFMATHPDYHDQHTHNYRLWEAMMQNPLILQNPYAAGYYARLQQQAPLPQYTCPTCREPVKNRPVEDFALKGLIRAVSAVAGEAIPKTKEQTRGKVTTPRTGPLDGFFPKVT